MKIDAQFLRDLIHEEHGPEWTVLEDEITGRWRWGIYKRIIVGYQGKLYGYDYQVETSHEDYRIIDCDDNIEVELWEAEVETVSRVEYREKKKERNESNTE